MYNKNENDNEKRKKSKRSDGPSGPGAGIKGPRNMFGWLLIIVFGVMIFSMMTDMGLHTEKIPYSEFEKRVQNGEVKEVTISGDSLTGEMKDEAMVGKDPKEKKKFEVVLLGPDPEGLTDLLRKNGVLFKYERPSTFVTILLGLLPWILLIGIMYFFIFRQFRGGGAGMLGSFGRSRHKVASEEQSKVTFEDVAGIDEAKDEVEEIIQFL